MILLFILLIILLFTRHYFVIFNLKNLKVRAIHLGIIEEKKKKWMASHHPNLTRANPNYTAIQHSNALQSRLAGSGVEN